MNYCNCPNCQTVNCPAATADEAQAQALVRSSELVSRLREQLQRMINRAEYVCAHRYGVTDPVGTRLLAIDDLGAESSRARMLLSKSANDGGQR